MVTVASLETPHVRDAAPSDVGPLAAVLSRAFRNAPGLRWLFPRDADWHRHSERFFRFRLRRVLGRGIVLTTDGRQGAATWLPPSCPTPGLPFQLNEGLQNVWMLRSRSLAGLRFQRAIAAAHPPEPHWYLDYLGTDPAHQRQGVASALVRPILVRCDAAGLPAFVATANERNLAFYGRHGFDLVGELREPWAPHAWFLRRPPHR